MFEICSGKDIFAHEQKLFLSFAVEDSYAWKNKDLDEEKNEKKYNLSCRLH